jgi:tRNA1(Val) A37 N6-methylase TrmN6
MSLAERTEGTLLGGRVKFAQPAKGYRAAIDPVLLAAAVPATAGESVLELGCGAGAALLCLARRVEGLHTTGLERDGETAALARENVEANGFGARVAVLTGALESTALPAAAFDHALMNPPHLDAARHRASLDPHKRAADLEDGPPLGAWAAAAARALKPRGTLTLVHRADRLPEILAALSGFGGILIFPLWPKPGRAAKRILVQASKGSKQPPALLPGLVLHREDGAYTPEADAVLRDGAGLTLTGTIDA